MPHRSCSSRMASGTGSPIAGTSPATVAASTPSWCSTATTVDGAEHPGGAEDVDQLGR